MKRPLRFSLGAVDHVLPFLCLRRIVKVGGVHLLDNLREEKEQKCLDQDSGDLAGIRWSCRHCGNFALETLPPRQLRGCRPLMARLREPVRAEPWASPYTGRGVGGCSPKWDLQVRRAPPGCSLAPRPPGRSKRDSFLGKITSPKAACYLCFEMQCPALT